MKLMITAIYARKSSEQHGVADEQRSVARQIEHATAYAVRKGWRVDDAHVYVDDGISGAEFANRPGFVRLMSALKPRAGFQVLVMSEESRLGREAIETAYALKQLVQAGVRVFFYLEDRERTLDSPTDKIMLFLTTFADELEREKARQRTYDAMVRKAKAGTSPAVSALVIEMSRSSVTTGTGRMLNVGSMTSRRQWSGGSSISAPKALGRRGLQRPSTLSGRSRLGHSRGDRGHGRRRRSTKYCSATYI